MKKVIWIYSINVRDGVAPNGYGAILPVIFAKKFQEKLKSALLPEVALQFISYDMTNGDLPVADLIVFHDKDTKFISNEIVQSGLSILSGDLYRGEVDKIKAAILARLAVED